MTLFKQVRRCLPHSDILSSNLHPRLLPRPPIRHRRRQQRVAQLRRRPLLPCRVGHADHHAVRRVIRRHHLRQLVRRRRRRQFAAPAQVGHQVRRQVDASHLIPGDLVREHSPHEEEEGASSLLAVAPVALGGDLRPVAQQEALDLGGGQFLRLLRRWVDGVGRLQGHAQDRVGRVG